MLLHVAGRNAIRATRTESEHHIDRIGRGRSQGQGNAAAVQRDRWQPLQSFHAIGVFEQKAWPRDGIQGGYG